MKLPLEWEVLDTAPCKCSSNQADFYVTAEEAEDSCNGTSVWVFILCP